MDLEVKPKIKQVLREPHRVWTDPITGVLCDEEAVGMDMILHILGFSRSTYHRHRRQLLDEGAIFYIRTRNPRRHRSNVEVRAFPSILVRWLHINSLRLERVSGQLKANERKKKIKEVQ